MRPKYRRLQQLKTTWPVQTDIDKLLTGLCTIGPLCAWAASQGYAHMHAGRGVDAPADNALACCSSEDVLATMLLFVEL